MWLHLLTRCPTLDGCSGLLSPASTPFPPCHHRPQSQGEPPECSPSQALCSCSTPHPAHCLRNMASTETPVVEQAVPAAVEAAPAAGQAVKAAPEAVEEALPAEEALSSGWGLTISLSQEMAMEVSRHYCS